MKVNAALVLCTILGGGQHGHLGLVLSSEEYARIVPGKAYVRATQPAVFVVDGTAIVVQQSGKKHNDLVKLFERLNQLERTLLQQIQEAIDLDYFKSEIDVNTGLFNGSCMAVLKLLFNQYGHVPSKQLEELRTETNTMVYDISVLINSVFNKVTRFGQMSTAAGTPKTTSQALEMAIRILLRSGLMATAIDTW